jgi:mannose-6-phosphate isomerase-like protein (cupin superfamily)
MKEAVAPILPNYYREERPWGSFERFTKEEATTVKLLHVAPHKRFSLQRHRGRSEFWRVVSGTGILEVGDERREISPGDEVLIEIGTLHRLTGGLEGISMLEISFGAFDENDIERVEDDFGRVTAIQEPPL